MTNKRALFCIDSNAYLRHIFPIISRFADSNIYDVEVVFLGLKDNLQENTLNLLSQKVSNIYTLFDSNSRLNLFFQNILALLLFLDPSHSSPLLVKRTSAPSIVKFAIFKLRLFPTLSFYIGRLLIFIVRNIYKLTIFADPRFSFFRTFFTKNKYSFVFSAPYIFPNTRSVPLQLACRVTSTPLVGQIASWDNLTTKGTWVVRPNHFFVWNDAMKQQLAQLHSGLDSVTSFHGSPTFESTRGYSSPFSRSEFLKSLSLSPQDKYILYLCSSPSIGGNNEDRVINELVSSLSSQGILTDNVHLVIRTHPLLNLENSPLYKKPPANVLFYPKYSTSPNLSSVDNDNYLSTIAYSDLVIGQNTSAFLDACLLDRPCITLPEYPGLYNPAKFGHIQLLLNGNFIHQPSTSTQLLNLMREILLSGGDTLSEQRQNFTRSFLYPSSIAPSSAIYNYINEFY